ncbi:LytS/YhcK type 5TM receptor domain-containing protein [Priestia endophytica]
MIHLVPLMIERVGIIVIAAFILAQMKSFRQIVQHEQGIKEKLFILFIFGAFGIISNYTGIEVHQREITTRTWIDEIGTENAIANTRIMNIVIGGILGGPLVGGGVGIIAGFHRYLLGGYTAFSCAISSVIAGFFAGIVGKYFKGRITASPWFAVTISMLMEVLQMIILWGSGFRRLVETIGVPMILLNGLGAFLFMLIIISILREEERTKAFQTHQAMKIAEETLPHFRKGLNKQSCKRVAEIMLKRTEADAIAVTNEKEVLAHVGVAEDHHVAPGDFATELTKKVLKRGEILTAHSKRDILCFHSDCPLQAAVVLPLKLHGGTVGTLKLYFVSANKLNKVERELAEGLANLFSVQLELAQAETQGKLLKDAEIKALQAQVHPHFLFNAINTISALCRVDVEKARALLLELSRYFRRNLQGARHILIPFEKELQHVRAYLSLEQARFPDKYKIRFNIEAALKEALIPPFILQPLVENAVRHALSAQKNGGEIIIEAYTERGKMVISVQDNGHGISSERLYMLGKEPVHSSEGTGTALYNISERLQGIYNEEALFQIKSTENGTKVTITVPLKGDYKKDVESFYCG